MEKTRSPFQHPPMFEVVGSTVDSQEVNRRLQVVFDALPRLWTDYAAQVVEFRSNENIDASVLGEVLTKLSLRPEPFLEWDDAYFDNQVEEVIRIARERGSHE